MKSSLPPLEVGLRDLERKLVLFWTRMAWVEESLDEAARLWLDRHPGATTGDLVVNIHPDGVHELVVADGSKYGEGIVVVRIDPDDWRDEK